ncbi:hypothetical protein FRC03_005772 [Tulasnella sp. 419]|nr:hypothetical protein FRC03_005772 [Tulasnella sp. 419]
MEIRMTIRGEGRRMKRTTTRRFALVHTRRMCKTLGHQDPIFILPRYESWEIEERSEDEVLIGRRITTTGTLVQRDESPVASVKSVNGVWKRTTQQRPITTKVQPWRRFTDENEVDPGEETQDEVVYKGSSGLGGVSVMNVVGAGSESINGIGAVGMTR